MKSIPDNCLAYYAAMPQTQLIDLSAVAGELVGRNISTYRESAPGAPVPDHAAVQFYVFNHLAALIKARYTPHEALPPWALAVMQEYRHILAEQGKRMTAYMCLITARESRHMGGTKAWPHVLKAVGETQCSYAQQFFDTVKGANSSGAANAFMTSIPVGMDFGAIIHSFTLQFNYGHYSGGYGGKPWGMIADTLHKFVSGTITQEMMIDTAYTLAHNNGPMFNKGMLYANYTSGFLEILDVQRSGQMPERVIELGSGVGLTSGQHSIFKAACEALPGEFGTYVDWYKVAALGGISDSIKTNQIKQDKKFGKKPQPTLFNGKPAKHTGEFAVAPGVSVKIVELERATA